MARTLILLETPCALTKVSFQQVLHPGELKPVTAGAPPILGKFGNFPKVVIPGKLAEHATDVISPDALS